MSAAAPDRNRAETLARLREHIARVAPARALGERLPSGFDALDRLVGGWPIGGLAELSGAPGSGRLGLVLPALRALTARQRTVAVVDPLAWLHPPGLPGVDLSHLLLVRPGATRVGWVTEQLARCGAVPLVVVLDPPPLRRAGRRVAHAAENGPCTVLVLTERADPDLPASLRITLADGRARLTRGGRGHALDLSLPGDPAPGAPLP